LMVEVGFCHGGNDSLQVGKWQGGMNNE
jgi:hypothetical protein